MARQEFQKPWWERPAKAPGEPHYESERENLRAELARARRAAMSMPAWRVEPRWGGPQAPRAAA